MIIFVDYEYFFVMNVIEKVNILYEKFFKFNNLVLFVKYVESKENFNEIIWKMGFDLFRSFFVIFVKLESVSF